MYHPIDNAFILLMKQYGIDSHQTKKCPYDSQEDFLNIQINGKAQLWLPSKQEPCSSEIKSQSNYEKQNLTLRFIFSITIRIKTRKKSVQIHENGPSNQLLKHRATNMGYHPFSTLDTGRASDMTRSTYKVYILFRIIGRICPHGE